MSETIHNWPPQYTIKKHPRARYVKIKASPQDGIEIIIPPRFNLKNIPEVLESHKSWIMKRLNEMQETMKLIQEPILPNEIVLNAVQQHWKIQYIKNDNKKLQLITRPQHELVLLGNIEDKKACLQILYDWVKDQAKDFLINRLQLVSQQTGLRYEKVIIRGQRGRWGSCTSKKNISLNFKLLFLPEKLMAHVLVHELCHTVHLNHSTKFWRLVATFDPDWQQHDKDLRKTEQWIPVWAH